MSDGIFDLLSNPSQLWNDVYGLLVTVFLLFAVGLFFKTISELLMKYFGNLTKGGGTGRSGKGKGKGGKGGKGGAGRSSGGGAGAALVGGVGSLASGAASLIGGAASLAGKAAKGTGNMLKGAVGSPSGKGTPVFMGDDAAFFDPKGPSRRSGKGKGRDFRKGKRKGGGVMGAVAGAVGNAVGSAKRAAKEAADRMEGAAYAYGYGQAAGSMRKTTWDDESTIDGTARRKDQSENGRLPDGVAIATCGDEHLNDICERLEAQGIAFEVDYNEHEGCYTVSVGSDDIEESEEELGRYEEELEAREEEKELPAPDERKELPAPDEDKKALPAPKGES